MKHIVRMILAAMLLCLPFGVDAQDVITRPKKPKKQTTAPAKQTPKKKPKKQQPKPTTTTSKPNIELEQKFTPQQSSNNIGISSNSDSGIGNGSIRGKLDGKRKMLSCDMFNPPPRISKAITVLVNVRVNDKGIVVWAKCMTPINSDIKKKVEQISLKSKWTPEPGAPDVNATITWTFKPSTK